MSDFIAKKTTRQAINNNVSSVNGFTVVNTAADNSCMFSAIAHQPAVRHRWQLQWRLESWLDACGTTNYVATRSVPRPSRMHQNRWRLGLRPDHTGGAYSAPPLPRPSSWIQGVLLLNYFWGEWRGGEGRGGEGLPRLEITSGYALVLGRNNNQCCNKYWRRVLK